jgi:competence protein CoiA
MQLYALDTNTAVFAKRAIKGNIYTCPECGAPLRVRQGTLKQAHFYHLRRPKGCHLSQKSEEHLRSQLRLLDLLGEEEGGIEVPFASIHRIADVAWHARKIVFEIQCSPISLEEAKARCTDYEGAGYSVIWILHDTQFNKRALSAAESFLRERGCYFTNVNRQGEGIVYDQFDIVGSKRRYFKGPPLEIAPTQLTAVDRERSIETQLPLILSQRMRQWHYFAAGDLLHQLLTEPHPEKTASRLLYSEKRYLEKKEKRPRLSWAKLACHSYNALLRLLLRKASS